MRRLKWLFCLALCLAALFPATDFEGVPSGIPEKSGAPGTAELRLPGDAAAPCVLTTVPAPGARRVRSRVLPCAAEGALLLCLFLCRRCGAARPAPERTPRCCVGHPHHAPPVHAPFIVCKFA